MHPLTSSQCSGSLAADLIAIVVVVIINVAPTPIIHLTNTHSSLCSVPPSCCTNSCTSQTVVDVGIYGVVR